MVLMAFRRLLSTWTFFCLLFDSATILGGSTLANWGGPRAESGVGFARQRVFHVDPAFSSYQWFLFCEAWQLP